MKSILGVKESNDSSRPSSQSIPDNDTKFNNLSRSISISNTSTIPPYSPKRATTIVNSNPVVHTIDEKHMNALKNDYGAIYHRHFSGLEV